MKILLLGAEGMLGHKISILLKDHFEIFASLRVRHRDLLTKPLNNYDIRRLLLDVDVLEMHRMKKLVLEIKPEVVINCVGIVKQRDEVKSAIPCININSLFPHQLATLCVPLGIRVLHFSTDCVFSGLKGDYAEGDIPDPIDLYGRSKLLGEISQKNCLTLRTSIIGWELKHRASLLEWFASQRGKTIKGYRKAIYSGVSTAVMARFLIDLINNHINIYGLYHLASNPISKYDLLLSLRDELGWHDINIEPDDIFYCDRSLDSSRLTAKTGWKAPSWDEMIKELASEWPSYQEWRN